MLIQLVRKSDQSQLNVSHGEVMQLLKAAKASDTPPLGSPRNGKPHLLLTLKFKGSPVTWVMGDTHAIWASHQSDEVGRRVFNALLERMTLGDSISVDITKAEYVAARTPNKNALKKLDDLDIEL